MIYDWIGKGGIPIQQYRVARWRGTRKNLRSRRGSVRELRWLELESVKARYAADRAITRNHELRKDF